MSSTQIRRLRGMEDVTGPAHNLHLHIVQTARKTARLFGYKEISTPLLEQTEIFTRTLGDHSDIVQKEMFTFESRGKESLTLRPEGTAGVVRHFLSEKKKNHLPLRFMYQGPMFRYERPQRGRLRQFHTVGMELLGEETVRGDIEVLSLAWLFLKNLGLQNSLRLEINSIGDRESRKAHLQALEEYLSPLKKQLSPLSQERMQTNPLRILDSKEPQDQKLLLQAPGIQDFLNKKSKTFFDEMLNHLRDLDIPFTHNPLLVRGLDYYSHCVFEFKGLKDKEGGGMGSQDSVLAGGRYDSLVETMAGGGDRVPGVGWGAGLERLSLLVTDSETKTPALRPLTLIPLGEEAEKLALKLAYQLRSKGFYVFHPRPGGLGKKMKKASQIHSLYTIIFGPEEIKKQTFSVKNMDSGKQIQVSFSELVPHFLKQGLLTQEK